MIYLVHLSHLTIIESNCEGILQRQKTSIVKIPLGDRSNDLDVLVGNGVNAPSSKHFSKWPLILFCSIQTLPGFLPKHNSTPYAIPQSIDPSCLLLLHRESLHLNKRVVGRNRVHSFYINSSCTVTVHQHDIFSPITGDTYPMSIS